jgi:hypothetical protein
VLVPSVEGLMLITVDVLVPSVEGLMLIIGDVLCGVLRGNADRCKLTCWCRVLRA